MITLTDEAAERLKTLMAAKEGAIGMRLRVKSTGCSGHSYDMEPVFEENTARDDRFEKSGAVLYVEKIQSWMLFGAVVDYITDELGNARFDVGNPNEAGRCGCGESFHLHPEAGRK
mgnify:CR=1 FL=1